MHLPLACNLRERRLFRVGRRDEIPSGESSRVDLMAFVFLDQLLCGHGRGQVAFDHGVF
jgi:hypothetical protein